MGALPVMASWRINSGLGMIAVLALALAVSIRVPAVQACLPHPDAPKFTLPRGTHGDPTLTPHETTLFHTPSTATARANLEHITSVPHVAGTPGDHAMATFVRDQFLQAGITNTSTDVVIDPQKVLLAYPVSRSLELTDRAGRVLSAAALSEDIVPSDPTSDTWWRNHTFNSYSPSGQVEGRLVYANFGMPEDFEALAAAGVSCKGAIVIMRYGVCFRGLKVKNAEDAGAVGSIIYSDPQQDGYGQGATYPNGPWRPSSSVQRGSIQFISTCAGDPARAYLPHNRTVDEVCGHSQQELIPQIPVLPLSWHDALPFLRTLGGPVAPVPFHGDLNLTYRMGPSGEDQIVKLKVNNTFQKSPVWNVIATIAGTAPEAEDRPVLLGNHRDAWVYGAADPNSGTAQLIEVARSFGALLKSGWRPRNTIILCSWSGEEFGLLGSTAWAEVNGDDPVDPSRPSTVGTLARASAYLNVDVGVSGPNFGVSGTPSLGQALLEVLEKVPHPQTHAPIAHSFNGQMNALGSGSDYTAFIDHLGIPSIDMHFSPDTAYGVYHSVYDSFEWMITEGDPTFEYHVAMARVWGLLALDLAGSSDDLTPQLLPINVSLQALAIDGYIASSKALLNGSNTNRVDFTPLNAAAAQFAQAASEVMATVEHLKGTPPSPERNAAVVAVNTRLGQVERAFLNPEGLPGRKWFRHVLQAPGLYTGYAPKTLPGVEHAITTQDWTQANHQVLAAAQYIAAAAKVLAVEK